MCAWIYFSDQTIVLIEDEHSPCAQGTCTGSLAAIPSEGCAYTRPVPALTGLPTPISTFTTSWKLFLSQCQKKGKVLILKIG